MSEFNNTKIIIRNDIPSNWQSSSPLAQGEIGFSIDQNSNFEMRVGSFGGGTWGNAIKPFSQVNQMRIDVDRIDSEVTEIDEFTKELSDNVSDLNTKVEGVVPVVNGISNDILPKLQSQIVYDNEKYNEFSESAASKDFIFCTTAQLFRLWDFINNMTTQLFFSTNFEEFKNDFLEKVNFIKTEHIISTYVSDKTFGTPEMIASDPANMDMIKSNSQK